IADFLNDTTPTEVITPEERAENLEQLYANPPILEVKNIEKIYYSRMGVLGKKVGFQALQDISFKVYEGETKGLVGESGSGKSTIGNAILQLDKATKGQIFYKGTDITALSDKAFKNFRKEIQIIFQDP